MHLWPPIPLLLCLVYSTNILKRLHLKSQPYRPGSYKTSLDTSPPPKSLSLHYKQINGVKNEVDGQLKPVDLHVSFSL